jgi:hypothetical protein
LAGGAAALIVLLLSAPAFATTLQFTARLVGRSETPPTASDGKGEVAASLDTETRVLTYKVTFSGLTGPATMAHFHGPAKTGQSAPPTITVDDPSSPVSGHAALTEAQITDLRKGLWYFNVHTTANPGGEIRGQLKRHVDWSQAETAPGQGVDLNNLPRMPTQIDGR